MDEGTTLQVNSEAAARGSEKQQRIIGRTITAKLINREVDALNPPRQEYVVHGQVSRPDNTLVADSLVQAFDVSTDSEQHLSKAMISQ